MPASSILYRYVAYSYIILLKRCPHLRQKWGETFARIFKWCRAYTTHSTIMMTATAFLEEWQLYVYYRRSAVLVLLLSREAL